MQQDVERVAGYVAQERRAAATYRALAQGVEGRPRDVLLHLAEEEEEHARRWEAVLHHLGADEFTTQPARLGLRGRILLWLARVGGLLAVVALLERREGAEITRYDEEPHAPEELVAAERGHAQLLGSLAPGWRLQAAATLRAGVFGMSDGLVSNLALVMGVVGADSPPDAVVVAGVAGLLAGSLSMAVGEYVSVASQREVLAAGQGEADPDAVGSPWRAASASLTAFALGAAVPLVPFLLARGTGAVVAAVLLAAVALYVLGAITSLLTRRPAWRSGARQLLLGLAAAGATFLIGRLLGVALQ